MDASPRCHGPISFAAPTLSVTSTWLQPGPRTPPVPPEPVWVKHLLATRWLPWCSVGLLPDRETELVVSVTDLLARVSVRGLFIEAGW